ncbi:MAG: carbon-nitrogen hydrolase family protein [Pseudomonadota bacterium]
MRIGLVQLNGSDDPATNLKSLQTMISQAVSDGAEFVLTPEVSNCLSQSRKHQNDVLRFEEDDPTLAGLRQAAAQHGIWLLGGSLGVKTAEDDPRFANRSFLISPDGEVSARYDKIHMFDVDVSPTETWRESEGYRPGQSAITADAVFAKIGMTICYDLRFPHLYRDLAKAGAEIITVPAAFSPVTGAAHWEPLLRARAIETGCFIIAPAQTGQHVGRRTYGHSLVVAPWGEVLLDMGDAPGTACLDIDLSDVKTARRRVPSLSHDRDYTSLILARDDKDT